MYGRPYSYYGRRTGGGGCGGRLIFALLIAGVSIFSYFSSRQNSPVTGETQYVDITPDQEIAMGLQAAPEMEAEFQGEDPNLNDQATVDQVGNTIVQDSPAGRTPYQYDFDLLADTQTVNAFALPGGQVFITRALYDLLQSQGELAGVLAHEISHVVARHSAEQIAKTKLTDGLTGAAVLATYDPNNPSSANSAQIAMLIGQMINLKYSRDDETEADKYGVCFMYHAGFDPNDMTKVMQILHPWTRAATLLSSLVPIPARLPVSRKFNRTYKISRIARSKIGKRGCRSGRSCFLTEAGHTGRSPAQGAA